MIVSCTYNATTTGSPAASGSTCRLPNACLHRVYCMAHSTSGLCDHDLNAWRMGMASQGNGCLSTLTSSLSPGTAGNDSFKPADEVVNMQTFALVTPTFLDLTKEDAQPCQGAGYEGDLMPPCVIAPDAPPNHISGKVFENHPKLVTTLSHWAAEWLQLLIIQSHRLQGRTLSYGENPGDVRPALASLIGGVIRCMQSPAQVIIHALWYIVVLTGDQRFKGESRDVTETPAFHLLHYKGSSCAEDFMLRTFIICAMVADKWVNDHPFPLKVWARVTQLPAPILAAMESCVLQGLRWNVHMTPTQWKNMLKFLRSSEPSYIELNPSTITSTLSSTIVVRILDKLTRLADAMETSNNQSAYNYDNCVSSVLSQACPSPLHTHALQPIRPSAEFFVPLEWCPEADPIVNKKPRMVGIAPGTEDRYVPKSSTACELLDSTLKSSHPTKAVYFSPPVATSFNGRPFGAIGHRLAHTVNHSWPNWFPAQG